MLKGEQIKRQTVKNGEQQSQNEVFKALLQIKDSLHALANDRSRDSHLKSHQADTRVSYGCKSYDHKLGNCPDGKSDNLRRAEESHTVLKLLQQDVCNLETDRNAKSQQSLLGVRTNSEIITCQLHAKQERRRSREPSLGKHQKVENWIADTLTANGNSYENCKNGDAGTLVRNLQTHNNFTCQIPIRKQKLETGCSQVVEASDGITCPVLLSRNKLLPCKGEKPPKSLLDNLRQVFATVSVAA